MARRQSQSRSCARPRRFDLHLPVWYRTADEPAWHTGTTQSISTNGAIIQTDEPVAPSDPIEVAISLPAVPGCLVGHGRIVRTLPNGVHADTTFAVAVDRYHIGRRNPVLS